MEKNNPNHSPSKTKKNIQTAGLLFILLVLPLGSWYYLSSGLNYQKTARAELKDYGTLPDFTLFDQNDKAISRDSFLGNMVLASFFRFDDPDNDRRFRVLRALHEQFDDRSNVWFAQHSIRPVQGGGATLQAFAKAMKLEDDGQCWYFNASIDQIHTLLRKGYRMPVDGLIKDADDKIQLAAELPQGLKDYPYFVLVDDKGIIRNYYDYRDAGQMKRLVEHIAFVMPK